VNAPALFSDLLDRGIWIRADGDRLHCDAPTGALTPELVERLRRDKPEILEYLRGPAVLSPAQQRLWFLDQVEADGAAYVIPFAARLSGFLDVPALERSLAMIVGRHESLRTTVVGVGGSAVQVVADPAPWALPVVDLEAEPDQLRPRLREQAAGGFDLAKGPLFRAVLYRLRSDEHVLLLLQHHIVSDAWSMNILTRELAQFYGDHVAGRVPSLPHPTVQYRDFARWQRLWLPEEALARQLAYWRTTLEGAPFTLDLPTDRPRPPLESHRGAVYTFAVPRTVSEGVASLARREGVTVFMALLSAFHMLLERYTGQEDLLIGTPIAGRGRAELEGVIGLFLNTLVLRCNSSGGPTVREFLGRVREVCLGAYAHQDLSFEMLVENLRPERDPSRNPLFQVMFVLQNAPFRAADLPGLAVTPVDVDRGASQLDLTLYVREAPDGLQGALEYATDLFDEGTIERLAGHWCSLLEGMVTSPERPVSELPLLTEAERRQVLVDWNATRRDYPATALVHEMFEAQAERTPDRIAVRAGTAALSYAELDARAARMAHALRSRGVGRGQRVGLCIERGAEMLAAVLGVLKAGAAYVPLDPSFPEARLRFMADDARLSLLVSTDRLAGGFDLPAERQLLLDADADSIASAPTTRLPADESTARPDDPAYVIYTSGSTGKPKGVIVHHRVVVNFLASMALEPGLTADDVLVAVTTLSFDIAVLELQLPLTVGATVVVASSDEAADGHALRAVLEQHHATVMEATPATWRLLVDAGWPGGRSFKALIGGDRLPRELAQQLIERTGELWNMYGPTETTVWSTCWRVHKPELGISIGRPIANTAVYVLDPRGEPCPIGVPGEIYIGGDGVTLGYLHREELTAERFLADPYSDRPGARYYRTGDLGRWLPNGTLEHLGRLDFQVKLRGFRIELGEIETALDSHPSVKQAVVAIRGNSPDDTRLVAYVTFRPQESATGTELRRFLRKSLPDYMLPNVFMELEELPLTANGKVDRRALPAPALEQAGADREFVAPRSDVEKTIAAVWQEMLSVANVSVRDNFFELGGHSLLAARMAARLEQGAGYRLQLRSVIFETLEQIAAGVEQRIGRGKLTTSQG
jgi:amino acid adenylation domain-containing protein